jgi:hypothetical protein
MPRIISHDDFIVNVGPEDFRNPIDLDKVLFVKQFVRGKDGIVFFQIEKCDDYTEIASAKIVDRWTFTDATLCDDAFDKLVKEKYGS